MPRIAIPGGTGGVGRALVDALVGTGKHEVFVLSRKAPETTHNSWSLPSAVTVLGVDYTDVEALTTVFESHNIEVVISTIFIWDSTSQTTEQNLILAADKSAPTKRYIVSNWGVGTPPEHLQLPQQRIRAAILQHLHTHTTTLESTQFINGFFLDYYAPPSSRSKLPSYLKPITFVLDIPHRKAVVPGTGNEKLSLTYTGDLAKFVARVVDMPSGTWEPVFAVRSKTTTWNEVIRLVGEEKVLGGVGKEEKLEVVYDSVEKLERGECTALGEYAEKGEGGYIPGEAWEKLQIGFGLFVVNGVFEVGEEGALNNREGFEGVGTVGVRDVLRLWRE